jgi:hypothetical protein
MWQLANITAPSGHSEITVSLNKRDMDYNVSGKTVCYNKHINYNNVDVPFLDIGRHFNADWQNCNTGSKNVWGELISTIIDLLDIIHRPVLFNKNVSETGFCLRPQVEAYSVGPNRQS